MCSNCLPLPRVDIHPVARFHQGHSLLGGTTTASGSWSHCVGAEVVFAALFMAFGVSRAQANDVFFMAGQSNAKSPVAMGIRDIIKAAKNKDGTPMYENVTMVWSNQNGSGIKAWYNGNVVNGRDIPVGTYGKFYGYQMFHGTNELTPPTTTGLLEQAMNAAPTPPSKKNVFRGFFWWQGEGDSSSDLSLSYAARFRGMIGQLGKDLNSPCGKDTWTYHIALPWNRPTGDADPGKAYHFKLIRAAQIEMVEHDREFGTYFDTKVFERNKNTDAQGFITNDSYSNPHTPIGKGYEIGLAMGKQFLVLHGKNAAEVEQFERALNAPANATLVRLNDEQNDTYGHPHGKIRYQVLAYPSGWAPAGRPGISNRLVFPDTLTKSRAYDLGAGLAVRGVIYSAPLDTTLNYDNEGIGVLETGDEGLDASSAKSRLILNCSIKTVTPQKWTVNSPQSIQFINSKATYDLSHATLVGTGVYDLHAGIFYLGSQANSASLSLGGAVVYFSAAVPAGTASPLGTSGSTTSPLHLGKNASLIYNGDGKIGNLSVWDRKVVFDADTAGAKGTFEVASPGVVFVSTGSFGPTNDTSNTTLNLRLGGAGNLKLEGGGGIMASNNNKIVCNLEKYGLGTLVLAGSGNSFNGNLVINEGTVRIEAIANINTCSGITVGTEKLPAQFEYAGSTGLSRPVTVNSGSVFKYTSAAPLSGALTLVSGATAIVDGPIKLSSLAIPKGARFELKGDSALPAGINLVNAGILDVSKWTGRLPANFVNRGSVLNRPGP